MIHCNPNSSLPPFPVLFLIVRSDSSFLGSPRARNMYHWVIRRCGRGTGLQREAKERNAVRATRKLSSVRSPRRRPPGLPAAALPTSHSDTELATPAHRAKPSIKPTNVMNDYRTAHVYHVRRKFEALPHYIFPVGDFACVRSGETV